MNQVEEILSQLKDGDKLIYNIAAKVIEQQQKRIDELEAKLKEVEYATHNVNAFIKKAEQMLREQEALIELREDEWDTLQKYEAWGVKRGIERIINFAKRHYV
jgi:S-adenosylmethionine:tRNA-ribosyltransferase-isomerase (queuine synthetase)